MRKIWLFLLALQLVAFSMADAQCTQSTVSISSSGVQEAWFIPSNGIATITYTLNVDSAPPSGYAEIGVYTVTTNNFVSNLVSLMDLDYGGINTNRGGPPIGGKSFQVVAGTKYYLSGLASAYNPLSTDPVGQGSFQASVTYPVLDYTYSVSNGVAAITSYIGCGGAVTIPSTIDGLAVTSIESYAFTDTNVTSVTIPDSVTNIGDVAFYNCINLTRVTIPNTVTNLGNCAFCGCGNLIIAYFAGSPATVYYPAFSTGEYGIVENVAFINPSDPGGGDYLGFDIGSYGFSVNAWDTNTVTITNALAADDAFVPATIAGLTVTAIGSFAFQNSFRTTSVTIPNTITNIESQAFWGTGLTNVPLLNSGVSLGLFAFGVPSITDVTIPGGVSNILSNLFSGCLGLTNVTIPNSVTSVGDSAFYECTNLSAIALPDSVMSIGDSAFSECPLTYVAIPNSVTNIGDYAFAGCNLTNITIPNGVTSIADSAFAGCPLTQVTIPNSVTNIGPYAFYGCNLTNISIPNSVTVIGDGAFSYSGLKAISIPDSVTTIGAGAFDECTNLTALTIPEGVTSIGDQAFYSCVKLANAVIPGSVTNIGISPFDACFKIEAITVDKSNSAYSSMAGVLFSKDMTTLVEYPDGQKEAPYTVPDTVTSVAKSAFDAASISSVTIPSSVTNIGANAFNPCISLTAITVSKSNPVYSSFAGVLFNKDQTVLIQYPQGSPRASYAIPNTVINIASNAFFFGFNLKSVTIPASVNTLESGAFDSSFELKSLYFQGDAPNADPSVFTASETAYYYSGASGWSSNFYGIPAILLNSPVPTGSLRVIISPAGAINAGAQWQIDGGANQNSGATATSLAAGTHTVSFSIVSGWNTPDNQPVTINDGVTTKTTGVYTALLPNSALLTVHTNGNGSVTPNNNGKLLQIGKTYALTAVPAKNCLFSNWVASGSESFISNNAMLGFTMESNLVLAANFVTNFFLAGNGGYYGLFSDTNAPRKQTNSGGFSFNLTSSGSFTGSLLLGPGKPLSLDGIFDVAGKTEVSLKPIAKTSLTVDMQLDFTNQTVSGTVSDGRFVAQLDGCRNVFSAANPAKAYEGRYTLVIPGTNDPTFGPYGVSYGSVTVSSSGVVTFGGALADGTVGLSQSSTVSQNGYWPLYLQLYGGAGSLWAWAYFSNRQITASASWINTTNSSKSGVYRGGFTNQDATVIGSWYSSASKPLFGFTNGQVLLEQIGASPLTITNQVVISSGDTIMVTNAAEKTNKLSLTINKNTGVLSGTFANPLNSKQTISVNGVILQGQTNAQGYFLGTNQSGVFLIQNP